MNVECKFLITAQPDSTHFSAVVSLQQAPVWKSTITCVPVFSYLFHQHHLSNLPITLRTRSSSVINISQPSLSFFLKVTNHFFQYASCYLSSQFPASFHQPHPNHSPSHSFSFQSCRLVSSIIATVTVHHSCPFSLHTQNPPFPQILPTGRRLTMTSCVQRVIISVDEIIENVAWMCWLQPHWLARAKQVRCRHWSNMAWWPCVSGHGGIHWRLPPQWLGTSQLSTLWRRRCIL